MRYPYTSFSIYLRGTVLCENTCCSLGFRVNSTWTFQGGVLLGLGPARLATEIARDPEAQVDVRILQYP